MTVLEGFVELSLTKNCKVSLGFFIAPVYTCTRREFSASLNPELRGLALQSHCLLQGKPLTLETLAQSVLSMHEALGSVDLRFLDLKGSCFPNLFMHCFYILEQFQRTLLGTFSHLKSSVRLKS